MGLTIEVVEAEVVEGLIERFFDVVQAGCPELARNLCQTTLDFGVGAIRETYEDLRSRDAGLADPFPNLFLVSVPPVCVRRT